MLEAGVVIGPNGEPIYWHTPLGRTEGSLPDSRELWDVLWENRTTLQGFAHSHPGIGLPGPSSIDVTTFIAVEAALGRRLSWWITSSDHWVDCRWEGPSKSDYRVFPMVHSSTTPKWVRELRARSLGAFKLS